MSHKGYRYSLDPFLLSNFIRVPPKAQRVLDLGTGSGIILFLLHRRVPGMRLFGLEIQGELIRQAREEKKKMGTTRISLVQGDIRSCHALFSKGTFDLVLSNPPYRKIGTGRINPDPGKATARHEIHVTLKDILAQSAHLLKDRGKLALIYHPSRLQELLSGMEKGGIPPSRLRFVHSSRNGEAKMVLVEGVRKGKGGLTIEAPLLVYRGTEAQRGKGEKARRNRGTKFILFLPSTFAPLCLVYCSYVTFNFF